MLNKLSGQMRVLFLLLILFTTNTYADDSTSKLKQISAKIKSLLNDISHKQTEHDKAQAQLQVLDEKVHQLTVSLRQIHKDMLSQSAQLEKAKQTFAAEQHHLQAQHQQLRQQAKQFYLLDNTNPMKVLLNETDPQSVSVSLAYYRYLNRARISEIDRLNGLLEKLAKQQDEIERRKVKLGVVRARQQQEQAELAKQRQQRSQLIGELSKELNKKSQHVAQLQADEQNLKNIVSQLMANQTQQSSTGFASAHRHIVAPLSNINVLQHYGEALAGSIKSAGVLLKAQEGEAVQAIAAGKVVFADWLRGYGLLLIVDHGDGYLSLYGHNESLYKQVGDQVSDGETIAAAGLSGGHEQVGLYFELRYMGRAVNPETWFS